MKTVTCNCFYRYIELRAELCTCSWQVRLLVEVGATVDVKDRWGHTPLDEARSVAATGVAQYLEKLADGKEL